MKRMQKVGVPDERKMGTINCPMWAIEANIEPFQRAPDVIAGRQVWGDDDEKDESSMCDRSDRMGWHEPGRSDY